MILVTLFMVSACATENKEEAKQESSPTEKNDMIENEKVSEENTDKESTPNEPTDADVCAFCNMVVYKNDHEMGKYTAQAINAKGEHLFFDDSGCLLNMERKSEEIFNNKWVRDHYTGEWIAIEESFVVHGDFETPMKYGYVFFKDEAEANQFIEENKEKNAVLSSWDEIDHVAHERYMKKMENSGGESNMHDHEMEGDEEHDNH